MKDIRPKLAQPFMGVTNADLGGVADNLASRLGFLKLRTTVLGVTAAIAVGIGMFLFLDNGLHLLQALRTVDSANGLPVFQIPARGDSGDSASLRVDLFMRFTLLFLWVAGIWGMSTRRLVGLDRLGWATLLVILALFILKPTYDEIRFGGISEFALRRAIAERNWDAAEQLAQTAPNGIMKTYLFAQIALHAGDPKGLLQFGQPFVDAVDSALLEADPQSATDALIQLKEVRPEVVYALEMALYGAPRTSAGIALFKRQATTKGFESSSHFPLLPLAASSMLLAISSMWLWLWLQMLRRIQRLQDWLQQGATQLGVPRQKDTLDSHIAARPRRWLRLPNNIFKILRAIAIGVGFYLFLELSTQLILMLEGVNLNPPHGVVKDEEPVYQDKNGKHINKADYDLMVGYDAAKEKAIVTHADCKSTYPTPQQFLLKEGCQKYVAEQKHFPTHVEQGHWDSGKTTAECRAEVDAYWDALELDARERGSGVGGSPRALELKECQNYDNIRIGKVVYEPTGRLDALLKKLEQGGAASHEDRETVRNDMQQVITFPENQYTKAYFEKADYFFQLADGLVKPRVEPPLLLSCEEFKSKIEELRSDEKRDSDAQAALKQGSYISNGALWDALNKSRIARLWDMKRYTDGVKSANCDMATKNQVNEPRS